MALPPERRDSGLPVVVLIVVLVLVLPALAFVLMMSLWSAPFGMMGWMGGWWPWGMVLGVGLAAAVVVLAIWFILRALEGTPRSVPYAYPPYMPPPPPGGRTALEILDDRYARGEISRQEYLRMRADLEGRSP